MKTSHWSAKNGAWKGAGIAIVGLAGRFPMARSVDDYWQNLLENRNCLKRLSREELLADGVSEDCARQDNFVPVGGVLDDIDLFDAGFFGISPREAESMDPQQRLFLEVVQHAFDDAGINPVSAGGPVGVYAGSRLSGYWLRLMKNPDFMNNVGWHQVAAGNDKDFLATQASFRFDLRGPSLNVQAACSTSLLALSSACDALVNGRCDVALAGAASISVPQKTGYTYESGSIASKDGTCRPFDAQASGSVLGNGVAAVLLKRVDDAINDHNRIYAVLRSVAINNDGKSKSSFAAPSVSAQAQVITSALQDAAVTAAEVGYVETHGTGTLLGDPIEVEALKRVFSGNKKSRTAPLAIGSVKSNVGHLDPVAGLASVIKVALSLGQEKIPATLHFETANPAIDFQSAGIEVVAALKPWVRSDKPRYAGVSAFGIGGTNVHAVLSEAPEQKPVESSQEPQLLLLSARHESALSDMSGNLALCLESPESPELPGVAYTLACGRQHFNNRRFAVVEPSAQASNELTSPAVNDFKCLKHRSVVLLFPGQGSQRMGMAGYLYQHEPVFRGVIDEVSELAVQVLGVDIRPYINLDLKTAESDSLDINQTAIAQPLLFGVGLACARLWMHWGVMPRQMLGHSVGELVAAHLAGVFSLSDAVELVCTRGKLMQTMPGGAMLAVGLDEKQALALQEKDLSVAAFNAPIQQTLSGSYSAIEKVEKKLREDDISAVRLATSHAFHHASMQPAADELAQLLDRLDLSAPSIEIVSCVTGKLMTPEQATSKQYWADSIVAPVRFSSAAQTALTDETGVFIECGSGHALSAMLRAHSPARDAVILSTLGNSDSPAAEANSVVTALGKLWQAGIEINWDAYWEKRPRQRVKLPGYAFQRQRFWIDEPIQPVATPPIVETPVAQPDRRVLENCYTRTWMSAPRNLSGTPRTGVWLVLISGSGLGESVAKSLRAKNNRVLTIRAGIDTQSTENDCYTVDPESDCSMRGLVEQLDLGPDPVRVVNTWPADIPPGPLTLQRSIWGAEISFWAPLRLLHSLMEFGHSAVSLHSLCGCTYKVEPNELPEPAGAPALGLTRVLPQEITGFTAHLIDVGHRLPGEPVDLLVNNVVADLLTSSAAEPVTAYRGGKRLVESFTPLQLPSGSVSPVAQPGGTYLITGGYGGIGGVLAKQLANTSQVRLVLVGRTGLDGPPGEAKEAATKLVNELESAGASVLALAADVTDPDQVRDIVSTTERQYGRINGVIHAAGVPGGKMVMSADAAVESDVLKVKLQGTLSLLESIVHHAPDFVFLCSSFATVTGGLGQAEYCAGNAYIEALAWSARSAGLNTVAVNWPAWQDVGMAHSMNLPPELEALHRESLLSGITPSEGAELFARIVAANLAQVIVTPFTPQEPLAAAPINNPVNNPANNSAYSPAYSPASIHESVQAPSAPSNGEPSPVSPPVSSHNGAMQPVEIQAGQTQPAAAMGSTDSGSAQALQARIGQVWSTVLGVNNPGPEDNFYELGGQSLMALKIVSLVSQQFMVEISLTEIFEHPTLQQFSDMVHQRMVTAVAQMSDEQVQQALALRSQHE